MRPQPTALALLSPALLAAALLPLPGLAAPLTNGDFATGTFAGWTTDTDGAGAPTPLSPDCQILGSPGSYAARMEADYYLTPGNTGSTPLDYLAPAIEHQPAIEIDLAPRIAQRQPPLVQGVLELEGEPRPPTAHPHPLPDDLDDPVHVAAVWGVEPVVAPLHDQEPAPGRLPRALEPGRGQGQAVPLQHPLAHLGRLIP